MHLMLLQTGKNGTGMSDSEIDVDILPDIRYYELISSELMSSLLMSS